MDNDRIGFLRLYYTDSTALTILNLPFEGDYYLRIAVNDTLNVEYGIQNENSSDFLHFTYDDPSNNQSGTEGGDNTVPGYDIFIIALCMIIPVGFKAISRTKKLGKHGNYRRE